MAYGAQPLIRLGQIAAGLVVLLIAGTILAVAWRAEASARLGAADWAAIRFTLWQAAWSAILSVALAIPLARALARRRFPGRSAVVTILGAPFILPVIVAVLGLLAIFGRNGLLNAGLGALGLPEVTIYGAWGVVLAHVFFNLPLATRFLLQAWLSVPSERFRLAASLGFGPAATFRIIEWPLLRATVPGAALVIFLICTTSFAVALTLGGGPSATTIELAIYQAFRFDFDLGRAALLALVQLGVTTVAGLLVLGVAVPDAMGGGLDREVAYRPARGRFLDGLMILLATVFLVTPIGALAVSGVAALPGLPAEVWWAAMRSIATALGSALLCLVLSLSIALAVVRARRGVARLLDLAGLLGIAASPLVIGTGLFILTFPWIAPSRLALPLTGLVNAIMAMPFALRALIPAVARVEADYGKLADNLGLRGGARLRILILPRLRRPIGFSAGLAAALSMGDLGVVALFADAGSATLPLQLYRLMGAYRMEAASGAALLLLGLSLCIFWVFDRGGRVDADA
ncbi:thiamine transport system permease protein [Palleronia aestuarii]|uniref:Thiamine transport system permease protein n=1 Tax=Palleronia aestuarii TaxID=568105 RepID=A0A2W7NHV8_9RHOB|nr:thiamine/thiamine pyrophosphate ABC transporter permease ThiP [Palleronia aestuarii]PZX19033.1 thiamine transport system permease protein [Palleronia aestuarii]